MMWIIVVIPLAFLLILLSVLLVRSSGKQIPFVDENGSPLPNSISEKIFIDLNGAEQGMFIKSRDVSNPVMLYLHGGMPDYFLTQRYPTNLQDYVTIVWWEQRGSGISFDPAMPREKMTLEQSISDTLELSNYLRHRFRKEKIYLMGHSGGTFIGIHVAAQAPELYHAYIGVSQMSNQLQSERLAYEYMLQRFKEIGNRSMVRKLEAAPVTLSGGTPQAYLRLRDGAMHPLGIGTTHDMNSFITGIILQSLLFKEYTLPEKVKLWRAKFRNGVSFLWDKILATDLTREVPKLDLPVYFLQGIYDYTCSYTEAKSYFQSLNAPVKGFYTFEHSAHCPIFEEPKKTERIMLEDVLQGANRLADMK